MFDFSGLHRKPRIKNFRVWDFLKYECKIFGNFIMASFKINSDMKRKFEEFENEK